MNDFRIFLGLVMDLFGHQFSLYGFSFTFWEVFMFSLFGGLIIWFIREVL